MNQSHFHKHSDRSGGRGDSPHSTIASNSSSCTPSTPQTPATPKHSYTLRFKKEVLAGLERNDNNATRTAKEYNISRQCIIRWRKAKDTILNVVAQSSSESLANEAEPETPRSKLISSQKRRRIRSNDCRGSRCTIQ